MSSDAVSDQLAGLNTELHGVLTKLKALIENRSAWADGVDGCREAVVLLGGAGFRLQGILDATRMVETDLASARMELDRWSKMHAELSTVERDLRAECDRYRQLLKEQGASRASVRALAEKLVREIG